MLRGTFLWLSQRQTLFNFVRTNGMARAFARRFVAGETLDEAVAAVRAINARGMTATLDLLARAWPPRRTRRTRGTRSSPS